MSATIALHMESRIVTKVRIPADDLDDQLEAVNLLRGGLIEMIHRFNESQVRSGKLMYEKEAGNV